MNELRVESYDAKDVAQKKRLIKKRWVAGGAALVITLGMLTGCPDGRPFFVLGGAGAWYESTTEDQTTKEQTTQEEEPPQTEPKILGGMGAWYNSVIDDE